MEGTELAIAGGEARLQACPVCSQDVEARLVRHTRPGEWEYRYSAQITKYLEADGETIHRCRLTPRTQTYGVSMAPPERVSEPRQAVPPPPPPPPLVRTNPPPQRVTRTSQERRAVLTPATAYLERYSGGIE